MAADDEFAVALDRLVEHEYVRLVRAFPSEPEAEALGAELLDLRAAVRSLPLRQREAVVLHYYLDRSISSVGDALGIGESAVKNALHKARGTLLAALTVDNTPGSTQ